MKIKLLLILTCSILIVLVAYVLYAFKNSPQNSLENPNNNITNQKNDEKKSPNNVGKIKEIKLDKFSPNPNWKDKTFIFNGKELHYKFGEGNPEETALKPEDYLAKGENDGIPYVTPETEKNLYDFLTDPDLPTVLDKCENYNRQHMLKLNPQFSVDQIPILLRPSDFDIENIMTINPNTGRKEINEDIANRMNEFLNILSNPIAGSEFGDKCAGTAYQSSIERIKINFSKFSESYINGGEGIKGKDWPK